ncbi:RNA-binding S4 domain-containing protein [Nordella sp. HKS 07]|uniref:RNA-binding S4 domain-containing protein n=1 Tax=Nordella sp. HKS 07 TaxID=2712222 RepID=UPI001FEFB62C|nr:RNA-binding S4 domain-containing protein [Nordella sp. HKS 07]
MNRQRIDKWLWFARMVKTRTLAAAIVSQGQVRLNKIKVVKPAQEVGPGDIITLAAHGRVRVLKVLGVAQRRGPSSEAQTLYEDIADPAASDNLQH